MRDTRADPDLIESSGRVKMLEKAMSWSGCREPTRTDAALAEAIMHPHVPPGAVTGR
jgi:hypothetical protein